MQGSIVRIKAHKKWEGRTTCNFCGVSSLNSRHSNLWYAIKNDSTVTNEDARSDLVICRFCARCRWLDQPMFGGGLLYIIPELTQAQLMKALLIAFYLEAGIDLYSLECRTRNTEIMRCRRVASRFINTLNQVGRRRWIETNTNIALQDSIRLFLDMLSTQPNLNRSLLNATKNLRFVPVLDHANQKAIIDLYSASSICDFDFCRWAVHFQTLISLLESGSKSVGTKPLW